MPFKQYLSCALMVAAIDCYSAPADTANSIHQRLIGAPPAPEVSSAMEDKIAQGDPQAAALIAMEDERFYDLTLKSWVTPWSNEAQTGFAPFNDYVATVIGLIRDEADFREVLTGDVVYVADLNRVNALNPSVEIPPYVFGYSFGTLPSYRPSQANPKTDTHHEALGKANIPIGEVLVRMKQSDLEYGLPPEHTAGVLTTNTAGYEFLYLGTNRSAYRFAQLNWLCMDMDKVQDGAIRGDRIRQDVDRAPADDPASFVNRCSACHTGLDAMSGAFAYFDFEFQPNIRRDAIKFTDGEVQKKYLQHSSTFPEGFKTTDDSWVNPWRKGRNSRLGWDPSLPGKGKGIKSLGQELANSRAFAACQVEKAYELVCLDKPRSGQDKSTVSSITDRFIENNYNLKHAIADVASYCIQ